MAFRDNVAHSNAQQGLTTYRPGWKPEHEAFLDGFKAYKKMDVSSVENDSMLHSLALSLDLIFLPIMSLNSRWIEVP